MRKASQILSDLRGCLTDKDNMPRMQSERAASVKLVEEAIELIERFQTAFRTAVPEKSGAMFICGMSPSSEPYGLPDVLFVCPAYGADVSATTAYRRVDHD